MNSLKRIYETVMGIPAGYFRDRDTLYAIELAIRDEVERQNPATMGAGHNCPYAVSYKRFLVELEVILNGHS